jgi:hypothetical protein
MLPTWKPVSKFINTDTIIIQNGRPHNHGVIIVNILGYICSEVLLIYAKLSSSILKKDLVKIL